MLCILFYIWNTTSGIRAPSSVENCGLIFFSRVETYSGILKLQRFVITCINPWSRIHTCRKYKWFLSAHLLDTLVTHVGVHFSGSTSDNTCAHTFPRHLGTHLAQPIGLLTTIVSLRTTLEKILSST